MPTTLELAGVPVPDHVGFSSLAPPAPRRVCRPAEAIDLRRLPRPPASVTLDGYKLILYPGCPRRPALHLDDDPHEFHDLASDPSQADRLATLSSELLRLQHELGDPLDLRPPSNRPFEPTNDPEFWSIRPDSGRSLMRDQATCRSRRPSCSQP